MKRIKFKEFPEERRALYGPDGLYAVVNYNEFLYARIQIIENKVEGYYILHDNVKYFIDKNGMIENWPDGIFDTTSKLTMQVIRARTAT